MESMTNVLSVVNSTFVSVVKSLYPEFAVTKSLVQGSAGERFGDYKCVASMPIAKVCAVTHTYTHIHTHMHAYHVYAM